MKKWILVPLLLLICVPSALMQQETDDLTGRIAYIGDDYNVYVLDPATETQVAMTDDATDTRRYLWPTWSNNNKLAYFCCDAFAASDAFTEVYISPDGVLSGEQVEVFDGSIFQYALWAPDDCGLGDKCRDLSVLITGDQGLSVELIRDFNGFVRQTVGRGSPFYQSFSPDGTRLLLQRDNTQFDVYDIESDQFTSIAQQPGLMQAPGWSPVDDRFLLTTLNEDAGASDLVVLADGEPQVLAEALIGQVSSSWSPNGNYVAYRTVSQEFGELVVVDSVSGERLTETLYSEVIAFFWSPDSTKLAFLTFSSAPGAFSVSTAAQQQEPESLAWWVLDVESDQVIRYANFVPTGQMIYIINFFDQFAQSHSFWSPDSTHLVFAEVTDAGDSVISLLDITQADAVPFAVADGVIGIWSYR